MSWKSFACVAALSAIIATPALAAPSLSFVDNMDGTVTLQVTPTGTGSIATEVFVSADNDLTSAVLDDAAVFDYDNPGNNPITSTVTQGLQNDLGNDQLFASHGSIVFNSASPVDYLVIGYTGSGTISASGSLLAEGGANFTGLSASIAVGVSGPFGDFEPDGDVDIIDFGVFANAFGTSTGDPAYLATADFEPDGDVDIIDFGEFANNFGFGTATAVPEPSSAVIAMITLASLGFVRRNG